MRCFQHNDLEAVGQCAACNAGGCSQCLRHYAGAKVCPGCAQTIYSNEVAFTRGLGVSARRRVLRAAIVFGVFFLLSRFVTGSWSLALFNAYGWASVSLATMPFVRAVGSRISGGAISTSVTGALFGTLWFWIVAGWWLTFFGMLYAYLGGGVLHLVLAIKRWRSAEDSAVAIPRPDDVANPQFANWGRSLPAGVAVPATPAAGTSSRVWVLGVPAAAALLLVGYCMPSRSSERMGSGCDAPGVMAGWSRPSGGELGASNADFRARPPVAAAAVEPAATVLPQRAPVVIPPATSAPLTPGNAKVAAVVDGYYRDLNTNTLDANNYFEPQVERFISMLGTNTAAMNKYLNGAFHKQFRDYEYRMEPGTLRADGPSEYVYIEHSKFFLIAKKQQEEHRYEVRIKVSARGKMTFMRAFHKLPLEGEVAAASSSG